MRKGLSAGMMLAMLFCFSVDAATITGTVTNQSTMAVIAGATLILISGTTPVDTVTSNASGVYTFDSVAEGSYTIAASATGYQPSTTTAQISGPNQTLTRNIQLVPLASIRYGSIDGTVTDSGTAAPLANVMVVLRQGTRGSGGGGITWSNIDTVFTLSDGTFLYDSVAENTAQTPYSLVFSISGHASFTSGELTVTAGATTTQDAVMSPASAVIVSRNTATANTMVSITANDQGSLLVRNVSHPGTLSLYTPNGRMVFRKDIRSGQNQITMPGLAGNAMIAVLSGNDFQIVERVSLCR